MRRLRPLYQLLCALPACLVPILVCEQAHADPVRLEVDFERSYIGVSTDKGGFLSAFVGHKHGILATEWSADICLDRQNPQSSTAAITVSTPSLKIDIPEARRVAGLNLGGPGPKDVREIQQKMFAPQNLAAEGHPEIQFRTTSVERKSEGTLVLKGPLTIRGKTQLVSVPVAFTQLDTGSFRFSGTFAVRQTDYGIKPESVAGVVKVKDKVSIRFEIHAQVAASPCR